MPTSVGFIAGEFTYKESFKIGDKGVVLIGEVNPGVASMQMKLQISGGRSVPILGVEAYGKGTGDLGLLCVINPFEDGVDVVPGRSYFVLQHVPIVKSKEESSFDLFSSLLANTPKADL